MPWDHTEFTEEAVKIPCGCARALGSTAALTHHAGGGWGAACLIRGLSMISASGQVDAISPEALPAWMPMTWLLLKVCICSQSLLTHFYWLCWAMCHPGAKQERRKEGEI